MNILGLNIYHADSSAALVVDGEVLAACEEERFTRNKHTGVFPEQSISWCLDVANLTLKDLDVIAIGYNRQVNLLPKAFYSLKNLVSPKILIERIRNKASSKTIRESINEIGQESLSRDCVLHHVEHHYAHLASAYYLSPYDSCALLSIDGMGDFASCMLGEGNDNRISAEYIAHFPHSLGYLYTAITILLGFPHFGDEYKVMGLAPYGTPRYLEQFRKVIRLENNRLILDQKYFNIGLQSLWSIDDSGVPHVAPCHSPALATLLEFSIDKRADSTGYAADVAASLQARTEEIIFALLEKLHTKYPHKAVAIAGGVAMNSVAIGKVTSNSAFTEAFVPPGAADNGVSIGAALYSYYTNHPQAIRKPLRHAYLGPSYDQTEIDLALRDADLKGVLYASDEECIDQTVQLLLKGNVIGWFQGRMEFGARALGNRSILADPRKQSMKALINKKIKNREGFRPFAPSILEEYVQDFFTIEENSPFMERVLPIRKDKQEHIPAVTHVDGSGRLQTVSKETNPKYWALINRFYEETGIPILLNTSFNQQEPVVCTPHEAINCFLRSGLDALVMNNIIVQK